MPYYCKTCYLSTGRQKRWKCLSQFVVARHRNVERSGQDGTADDQGEDTVGKAADVIADHLRLPIGEHL